MSESVFDTFFTGQARGFLSRAIRLALEEDGPDLTSLALFGPDDAMQAVVVAKEQCVVCGLPLIPLILAAVDPTGAWAVECPCADGDAVGPGEVAARVCAQAAVLLKAERVILNFICRLSGVATLTRAYVDRIGDSSTRLLDTRKTTPGLRYPEKYAVRIGGGTNHRLDLASMLMLKDTHIDRAGSITAAVAKVRAAYAPCPPLEVECRTQAEVDEAVAVAPERIMLDNMGPGDIRSALARIPASIETEISGNVTLDTIAGLAALGATYISIGRITHSAPAADFSMRTLDG